MDVLYNHPKFKDRRRELRRNMTKAECLVWEKLRGRRFLGLKFHRQYSVDRFILDFYCPKLRLAIELDGSVHDGDAKIRDKERDAILLHHNIDVLRFKNELAISRMDTFIQELSITTTSLLNTRGIEGVITNFPLERKRD